MFRVDGDVCVCDDRSITGVLSCLSVSCISETVDTSSLDDAASFLCNTSQQQSKFNSLNNQHSVLTGHYDFNAFLCKRFIFD